MGEYLAFWWAQHVVQFIISAVFIGVLFIIIVIAALVSVWRDSRKARKQ